MSKDLISWVQRMKSVRPLPRDAKTPDVLPHFRWVDLEKHVSTRIRMAILTASLRILSSPIHPRRSDSNSVTAQDDAFKKKKKKHSTG